MTARSLKRRWLRTKIALSHTIEKILDINRRRKGLMNIPEKAVEHFDQLNEELLILNKIADHQARLLKKYEHELATEQV